MVTFSLRQATALVNDPAAYQVTNEITAAPEGCRAVYVYKTLAQTFSHYATAADMARWPDTYDEAQRTNAAFYRLPSVVRTWHTLALMNLDLDMSVQRLQALADELTVQRGALTIDRTIIVRGV